MPFRFGIFSTGHSSHRLFPASVLLTSRSFSHLIFPIDPDFLQSVFLPILPLFALLLSLLLLLFCRGPTCGVS